MQSSITHHTTTRKSLEVIVPASEVNAEYNEVITKISLKVKIPGFRPGKASKDVILARYEKEIRSEVAEALIKKYFMSAARSSDVQPISRPMLEKIELNENSDGVFNILFDVAPEVVVSEYKDMNIKKQKRLISDDDITEHIEYLRQETAKLIPVDNGFAELNHHVTMDVTVKPQGLKSVTYDNQVVQLTSGRPFDAEILNMQVGETKKFSITVPTDDSNDAMAGKTVAYEVTVRDLRIRELAEIDDDFAKDFGQYATLDELKTSIRTDLENFAEADAVSRAHQNILENLLNKTSFEVPSSMVEMQLDDYCQEFAKLVSKQGIDPKKIHWEAYRKSRANEAERVVRSSYILQYIGDTENIQANDEDVDKNIKNFMKEHKIQQPFEVFRKKVEDDGVIDEIKGRVRTYNTLNHILSLATVTEELLDKDAFTNLVEAERRKSSHTPELKQDIGPTEEKDIEQAECQSTNCNHNNGESVS